MGYFNRNKDDRGNKGRYSNNRGGRRNDNNRGQRSEMYDAVCSKCGDKCQVPFKPNGRKPILCSHCFGKERSISGKSTFEPKRFDRSDRREKPAYRSTPRGGNEEMMKKMRILTEKVDRILQILTEIDVEIVDVDEEIGEDQE